MSCNTIQPPILPLRGLSSRTSFDLLPTHLRVLSVRSPSVALREPSSTPFPNCPDARLGKNSLAIRFIFSRHGDLSLYPCYTKKNRAVVVSPLNAKFFLHARSSFAAFGLITRDKCKIRCLLSRGGDGSIRFSRRIFAGTER